MLDKKPILIGASFPFKFVKNIFLSFLSQVGSQVFLHIIKNNL